MAIFALLIVHLDKCYLDKFPTTSETRQLFLAAFSLLFFLAVYAVQYKKRFTLLMVITECHISELFPSLPANRHHSEHFISDDYSENKTIMSGHRSNP